MRDRSHIPKRGAMCITRSGFTLIETAISLGIIGILMVSLGSVVALAGRAVTTSTTGSTAASATARTAVDMITSDLEVALTITEQTPTAVTFTVPARGTDVSPETIRYAWDGIAGHSLTRQYNSGAAVSIADNVSSLNLAYLKKTIAGTSPPPATTSAEQLLASHDGGSGSSVKWASATSSSYAGEYFFPSLPVGTVTWSVTRLQVQVTSFGAVAPTGILNVALYAADANHLPTGSALCGGTIDSSLLNGTIYSWVPVVLSPPCIGLDPTQGLVVVVVGQASGNGRAGVLCDTAAVTNVSSLGWTATTNSGSTWSALSGGKALQFYVYGTASSQ